MKCKNIYFAFIPVLPLMIFFTKYHLSDCSVLIQASAGYSLLTCYKFYFRFSRSKLIIEFRSQTQEWEMWLEIGRDLNIRIDCLDILINIPQSCNFIRKTSYFFLSSDRETFFSSFSITFPTINNCWQSERWQFVNISIMEENRKIFQNIIAFVQ